MPPAPADPAPLQFLNRRQAMSLMAASLALANGACTRQPEHRLQPFVQAPEARAGRGPVLYASAVVREGFALGVLVSTQEGRPTKIEGHPQHPASLGATDASTQASVLDLWDPDRSATVRERKAGGFGPSTWDAFASAWSARAAQLDARRGEGLHVVTGVLTSPSERAQLQALRARWPLALWHVHEPLRDPAADAGVRAAFGRALRPLWRLDRARCIVALAADPFSDGPAAVRQAMDWARQRRADAASGGPARLFAAEVTPGLFGSHADERVALPPHEIEALLWRVAAGDAPRPGFESRLAQALRAAGPDAIVITGRGLSPQAHARSLALNQRLGAVGRGLAFIAPPDAHEDAHDMAALADALHAGAVQTLVLLGVNPAYDGGGAGWPEAFARAAWIVHAGTQVDESAALAHWHLPLSHDHERWGDALAFDGTHTLLQPAISPLYDSRSPLALLAMLAGTQEHDEHALLRQSMAVDEDAWRARLRAGFVPGSAFPPVAPGAAAMPMQGPSPPPAGLVVHLVPDPVLRDGRQANNGWLQELPKPFSQITWDNALQLGPRTAARLGLASGDLVEAGTPPLRMPVWIDARQAEDVAVIALGLGRRSAGRVGNGVGFDAYPLRGATTLALRKLDGHHDFARTQTEHREHDRHLVRDWQPGTRIEDETPPSLYPDAAPKPHAWAMAIDLDSCIGCNACSVACQAENNIPVVGRDQVARGRVMHWIRVDRYERDTSGSSGSGSGVAFQPVPCMHCEHAPCELVCPVGATQHDDDGLNVQVYNRCIGTRFCSNNCPYKVRRFNFLPYTDAVTETLKAQRNPEVTVREKGVMEKCTYCIQRIVRAGHEADRLGVPLQGDGVVTACQAACPTRAIHFGDLHQPGSDIVAMRASPRHYALLGELGTRPRTTYLARVEG